MRILCTIAMSFVAVMPTAAQVPWYTNDFEDPSDLLSEWSPSDPTDTTPGTVQHSPDRFKGQHGRYQQRDDVILSLENLPAHTEITVSFDLYIIRSWDGNSTPPYSDGPDIWGLSVVGGPALLHTTFSNIIGEGPPPDHYQAYPGQYPDSANPPRTGAAETFTLGYHYIYYPQELDAGDAVYHLCYTFPHTDDSLHLSFFSEPMQQTWDESWGLDNVVVTLDGGDACDPAIPTVSEWGMASVVLLLLAGLTIKFGALISRKAA